MIIDPSSQQEFSDADFRIVDNGDQSKKLAFQVSGITTATTRTWTVPDADLTLWGSVSPTFTGTLTGPLLRLTDATDASLSSTGHAFQIGSSGGMNLIADGNEIMARNNGAASLLALNNEGGTVTTGGAFVFGSNLRSGDDVDVATVIATTTVEALSYDDGGALAVSQAGAVPYHSNRLTNDGSVFAVYQDGTFEGGLSVSGTTVSVAAATVAHWGQALDGSRPDILLGTILETLDDMSQWYHAEFTDEKGVRQRREIGLSGGRKLGDVIDYEYEEIDTRPIIEMVVREDKRAAPVMRGSERVMRKATAKATIVAQKKNYLPRIKVSDVPGSTSICGLFMFWDADYEHTNDLNYAGSGTYKVRIHKDQNPIRGDLIESNGDGTGRVQSDSIIRSSTVAKINAAVVLETYPDGSKLYPCFVLCA